MDSISRRRFLAATAAAAGATGVLLPSLLQRSVAWAAIAPSGLVYTADERGK